MFEGILSIQSAVAYGHVGNSAAAFPLQRLGFEVWPVNTVLFSNHTGYGAWRGHGVALEEIEEIVRGVEERGAFPRCRAVLSGYLGTAELGRAVLDTVAAVRRERPDALYACDPVMGDEGRGFFVRPGLPEFFRDHAVPAADIVTPNQFELAWLAAMEIASVEDALEATARVRRMGPKLVACTSLVLPGRENELAIVLDTPEGAWAVWTPRLPVELSGTGDVFMSLLLGNFLKTGRPDLALEAAGSAMFGLVEATWRAKSRELVLIAAQDELVAPRQRFGAHRLR
ncbi:pyridoxal kinase PdxY [Geminicoccaceae bacterium 1502E]|nr:pyridoxal kinase PdxY [Geminicoccaceae bacterium 1502E]